MVRPRSSVGSFVATIPVPPQDVGKLKIIGHSHSDRSGHYWVTVCECTTIKVIAGHNIKNGRSKSCGCEVGKATGAMRRASRANPMEQYCPEAITGCWLWTGRLTNSGYGQIAKSTHGEWKAHRLFWRVANGPIPGGLCVLHKCDTPACVNPDHLFLGTQADNVQDMMNKHRSAFQKRYGWE